MLDGQQQLRVRTDGTKRELEGRERVFFRPTSLRRV